MRKELETKSSIVASVENLEDDRDSFGVPDGPATDCDELSFTAPAQAVTTRDKCS